ncbi:leucine-rich repeat LGI family member 2 isoform X2 [Tympanuchus pallidicinctus]|uniref:leucine-rich repeat LGI family member 2 isoform X2 n=1 Tax=Tympanuchus pallidicinctus TaxID=109042 RepID=UPI0022875D23|nr:leucine-rich repeat LGI family member 2 isoform X2 [Tympanuchus pallidicinctus]
MTGASKNSSVNTESFLNKQRILTHKLVCFNLQISSKCFKTVEISFSVLELCFFPLKILKMFQFSLTTSVSVPSFATSYDLSLLLSAKFVVGVSQSFCFSSGNEDFVVHQILPYQSVSVDTFNSKNDVFVAIAQPSMENCMVLEWDHIEMNFRSYDNITVLEAEYTVFSSAVLKCLQRQQAPACSGQSIVGCKAILVGDQVFVVVAQLFGGSHIYKYDESWTKFVKFQDIEVSRISKPNDIELFEIDSEMFFVIADSSKAGLSTVYKWNNKGFYSYQSLHEWFRDTDAEFLDIDGKSHLILSSRSQVPIILQWNKASKKFVPHGEIPNMEDVLAVKSFRMQNNLYITLTRFIGDSRVMKWNSKQFVEIQALPSRGAMTLQPFSFKNNYYLALGSDYTFSQIYQWDGEKKLFRLFKEIYVQAPRSFTAVSTDRRDFFFASSFKGNTQIFEHIIIDLSL